MSGRPPIVGPTQFLIGFQAQREWAWLITAAFLFGTLGAGTYTISFALDFHPGALVALAIVGLCKGAAHMLYLGKPLRFPLAVRRWRTSWISRGIIAMFVFLGADVVYVSRTIGLDFVPEGVTTAFGIVALAAAIVIMVYDGFVLRACRGIPLWRSWLMPVVGLGYALLGGCTATLVVEAAVDEHRQPWLEWLQLGLLLANVALVAVVVLFSRGRDAASAASTWLLLRGPVSRLFLPVALGVGIGVTLVLAAVSLATGSTIPLVLAAVTDLVGEFFLFFSLLRAGLHPAPRPASLGVTARGPRVPLAARSHGSS